MNKANLHLDDYIDYLNKLDVNKLSDYKDVFINDVKNSSYYWWRNNDEKLYKLMYILYLQDNIYSYICKCIENTIKYNYYHEITRIDDYEKM